MAETSGAEVGFVQPSIVGRVASRLSGSIVGKRRNLGDDAIQGSSGSWSPCINISFKFLHGDEGFNMTQEFSTIFLNKSRRKV